MNSDERILKALEDLKDGQKTLQADVNSIKDIQQKHGERLESVESGQKELNAKVDNVELKVEVIHEYQQKAHGEIMGIMTDISEINGQEQKKLEKRVERIEEHLELPPMK
ncbi:MAG TPA: hypothetical protein VFC02_14680 [Anaerolineales bacterium]|nr:hypothetical protein [Anaerolineales bacterium]